MRVSIVTTTFNALPYVAETTRSILQSGYADMEYLVVDAGSTDGTLQFLRGIRDERVRVEVLEGASQYAALEWGFRQTTGEVLAWLNADDIYFPWTIQAVAQLFAQFPDTQWITGLPTFLNGDGICTLISSPSSYPRQYIRNGWFHELAYGNLVQESMFWRRNIYERAGGLNLKYDLAADFELWTRFAGYAPLEAVNIPLAAWRKHGNNRSLVRGAAYRAEVAAVTAGHAQMSVGKRCLCRRRLARLALRLAEWHRTPWIYYSQAQSQWKRGFAIRPISRYGLQYLKMEFFDEKAKQDNTLPFSASSAL